MRRKILRGKLMECIWHASRKLEIFEGRRGAVRGGAGEVEEGCDREGDILE